MKSPPMFLRGAYKSVRFALQEARDATVAENEQRKCRAWKLFLLAPRILLFRKTQERFAQFRRGDWMDLLLQSRDVSEEATAVRSRRHRTQVDTVEQGGAGPSIGGHGRDLFRSGSFGRSSSGARERGNP